MLNCEYCKQDVEKVRESHEEHGHNIQHSLRYDLVQVGINVCEDCIDNILEDILC